MKQDLKIIIGVGLVVGICVAGAGDVFAQPRQECRGKAHSQNC